MKKYDFKYEKAKKVHNDKYDYSLVDYKNIETKVIIVCPIHGKFEQKPYKHVERGQGCGECRGNRISKTKRFDIQKVIDKSNIIHDFKYDYSKSEYTNMHTKTIITCKKHGDFNQNFNNHIFNKCGCPSCGYNVSIGCTKWLDDLNIEKKDREIFIRLSKSLFYKVDAYVEKTNTIYEYFGNFWHGNEKRFNHKDINPKNKTSYGELYKKTIRKISNLRRYGYKVVYIWGD